MPASMLSAGQQGDAFVPGATFHVGGSGYNTIRLNFSNSTPQQIRNGIARLAFELHEMG